MKNKKVISIFVLYLFLLTVLPMSFIASKVNAEDNNSSNLPTYSYYNSLYNGLYCDLAVQYKDKTIFNNRDWYGNYHSSNIVSKGKTTQITGLSDKQAQHLGLAQGTYNNKVYFANVINGDIYKVDVNSSEASLYKSANPMDGEAGNLINFNDIAVDNNGDCWYQFLTTVSGDNYDTAANVVTKSSSGYHLSTEADNNDYWYSNMKLGKDGSIWVGITNSVNGNKLYRISNNTQTKYDLESDGGFLTNCIADANGNIYVEYYYKPTSDNPTIRSIFKHYILNNGKLVLKGQINKAIDAEYTEDNNGNIWELRDGIISKLVNDSFTSKYKVNSNYHRISVYDDNNMVVYSGTQYTIINNDGTTDDGQPYVNVTPQVTEQGNDEVVSIDPSSLSTAVSNMIQVNTNDPSKNVVFHVDQIKKLNGIAQINNSLGQIILPFQMLDLNSLGLSPESTLSFNERIDTTSEILKNIQYRTTGKVFEFNLFATDSKTRLSQVIHKFKDGTAKITIKLTQDDIKGLDTSKLAMLYYDETTKAIENLGGTFDKTNLTFTFKTPHFSKFVLAEVTTNVTTATTNNTSTLSNSTSLPSTGSMINIDTLAFAGIAFLGAGSFALLKKKEN